MTTLLLTAAMFIHFAWHLIATASVIYSLHHSNQVHGKAKWKMVAAIVWAVISLLIMMEMLGHVH